MLHTTSSIRDWRKCRRLYRYAYVDLVRPARDDTKRTLGSLVHKGIEVFLPGAELEAVLAVVDGGGLDDIERARCRAMLRAYYAQWAIDRRDWQPIKIESQFSIDLGKGVTLGGKQDAVARRLSTGALSIWEHKTTSEEIANVGSPYWQRLAIDLQLTIYQEQQRRESGEMPGLLYDVIRKPGGTLALKKCVARRKGETDEELASRKESVRESVEEFEDRLFCKMVTSPDEYFVRREVFRLGEQNEAQLAELFETIGEIERYTGLYPRSDGACQGRYGLCPYLSVCAGVETLDSERFVKLETSHPELSTADSDDLFADCPL